VLEQRRFVTKRGGLVGLECVAYSWIIVIVIVNWRFEAYMYIKNVDPKNKKR